MTAPEKVWVWRTAGGRITCLECAPPSGRARPYRHATVTREELEAAARTVYEGTWGDGSWMFAGEEGKAATLHRAKRYAKALGLTVEGE